MDYEIINIICQEYRGHILLTRYPRN